MKPFQNTIFEQATEASDQGAWIQIPRLVISAGIELNEAHSTGRVVNWKAIDRNDARVKGNSWYVEGRVTPPLGKQIIVNYVRTY